MEWNNEGRERIAIGSGGWHGPEMYTSPKAMIYSNNQTLLNYS
jgi:hypothetical protein